MIVLVDTTVWIDFFGGKDVPHVEALETLLTNREDICTCGVVLTEVLQGIRKDTDFRKTRILFDNLLFLPMPYAAFLKAAELYRTLRQKGVTIRNAVDCMIAAVAIENNIKLLHNDKDYRPIEKYCGLKVLAPK